MSLTQIIAPSAFRLHIGKRAQILPVPPVDKVRTGTIRFSGTTDFSEGAWVGVELDTEFEGKNCGTVNGVEYFRVTNPGQGIFVRPELVQLMPEAGLVALELRSEIDSLKAKLAESERRAGELVAQMEELQVEGEIASEEKLMLQDEVALLKKRIDLSSSPSSSPNNNNNSGAVSEAAAVKMQQLESKIATMEKSNGKLKSQVLDLTEQLQAEARDSVLLEALMDSKLDLEAALQRAEADKKKMHGDAAELEQLCQMQAEELSGQQRQLAHLERVHSARLRGVTEALSESRGAVEAIKSRAHKAEEQLSLLSKSDDEKQQLLAASQAVVAAARSSAVQMEQEREVAEEIFDVVVGISTLSSSSSSIVLRHFISDEDEMACASVAEQRVFAAKVVAASQALVSLAAKNINSSRLYPRATASTLFAAFHIGLAQIEPKRAVALLGACRDLAVFSSCAPADNQHELQRVVERKLAPILKIISSSSSSSSLFVSFASLAALRECFHLLLGECAKAASVLQERTKSSSSSSSSSSCIADFIAACRDARLPEIPAAMVGEIAPFALFSNSNSTSNNIFGEELAQSAVNFVCVLDTLLEHVAATTQHEEDGGVEAQRKHAAIWLESMTLTPQQKQRDEDGSDDVFASSHYSAPPSGTSAAAIIKASVANLSRVWVQLGCDDAVVGAGIPLLVSSCIKKAGRADDAATAKKLGVDTGDSRQQQKQQQQQHDVIDQLRAENAKLKLNEQRRLLVEKELSLERQQNEETKKNFGDAIKVLEQRLATAKSELRAQQKK